MGKEELSLRGGHRLKRLTFLRKHRFGLETMIMATRPPKSRDGAWIILAVFIRWLHLVCSFKFYIKTM